MSSGLARSSGRHRKQRALVVELWLGLAAFAVGAVTAVGPLAFSGSSTGSSAPGTAPAPFPPVRAGASAASAVSADATAQARAEATASGPSRYTDRTAVAYFRGRWHDRTAKRISDIRTTGRYLRIYTDLPEDADNSATAIMLCQRGLEYLFDQGEADPVVFVQARFGENGNPVLANVLGPDDRDCRVTHPRPR